MQNSIHIINKTLQKGKPAKKEAVANSIVQLADQSSLYIDESENLRMSEKIQENER